MNLNRIPRALLSTAAFLVLATGLGGCNWWYAMTGHPIPVMVQVDGWKDIEIMFSRIEKVVDTQPEIVRARMSLDDADGDGKFPIADLGFLIYPIQWAAPHRDPIALYEADVQADLLLTNTGRSLRLLSSGRIRTSLQEILLSP